MAASTSSLNGTNPAATHNGYDMYDFSEVTSDLAILRSQLFTLNVGEKPKPNNHVTATWDPHLMAIMEQATKEQDDEEWYPPSPPIYDVADKLIEINRDHQNDPASEFHLAGRLRWRPDDNLVQIKWLYKNDWESLQLSAQNRYESAQNCYAEETESEEEDSSSADECGSLAVHLSRTLNLMPPTVRMDLLPTIEDVSPDTSSKADYSNSISAALQPPPSVVLDYVDDYEDDEDFEEPSLAIGEIRSPLRDEDIVSQMETIEMSSVSSNEESSSGSGASSASGSGSGSNSNHSSASAHSIGSSSSSSSSASSSCKTTKVSFKKPLHSTTSEANNNEVRPSRPRTKTTVIRTHENVQCGSTQLMSSNQNNPNHPKKSTTTTQNPISMPKLIENSSHNSSSNSNSSICKSSSSNSHNNSTATVSNRVYSKAALASKTNGVQATNSSSSSSTSGVGSQSHAMNTHSSRIKIAHSGSGSNSSLVANNNNNSCSSSGEDSLSSCAGTATASSNPPSLAVRSASSPPRRNSSSTRLRSSSLQPATTKTRKVITETRPKTTLHKRAQSASAAKNKTSVYIGTNNSGNSNIQGSNNSGHPGNGSLHSGRDGREISTLHSGRDREISTLHNGRETSTTTSSSQQPRFHSSSTVANSIYLQDNNNAKKQKHQGRQRSTGSAAAILHRKNSRNSLSSNSSVSSQTTEDGTSKSGFDSSGSKSGFSGFDSSGSGSSNSVNCRRYSNTTMSMINSRNNNSQPIHHRHPSIVADVISNNPGNGMSIPGDEIDTPHFLQWKKRKREEKRLRERKSFLEQQMRRH